MRRLVRFAVILFAVALVLFTGLRLLFGGGKRLEDRTTAPALPASAIEVVANLDYPPGNIAVSKTGPHLLHTASGRWPAQSGA